MSREHQLEIAGPLRAALWGWIECFPHEFNDIILAYKAPNVPGGGEIGRRARMDGLPERVFDLLYSKSSFQGGGGEKVLWPTLTVLSCISMDRWGSDGSSYASFPSSSKLGSTTSLASGRDGGKKGGNFGQGRHTSGSGNSRYWMKFADESTLR